MAAYATGPEGQSQSGMIRAALSYAARGVPVFPCEPSGKKPLTYNGFWEATTDERRIKAWWGRWPKANIGVPTGRASGLLVLDVDAGAGFESLAELELSRGELPKTARARTGGGGEHVYFRYPKDIEVRNSQGYLGLGLDIRAKGGYVVVPPSRTTTPYEWVDRSRLADASWLLGYLKERPMREAGETLF
jgi:hypothetical protein